MARRGGALHFSCRHAISALAVVSKAIRATSKAQSKEIRQSTLVRRYRAYARRLKYPSPRTARAQRPSVNVQPLFSRRIGAFVLPRLRAANLHLARACTVYTVQATSFSIFEWERMA